MRRLLLIILPLMFVLTRLSAIEHEDILTIGWGGISQNDEYLTPLTYSNYFISLQNQWNQPLTKDSVFSHTGILRFEGQRMFSPTRTNMMYGLSCLGQWGADYNFSGLIQIKGLNITLGPALIAQLTVREHASNVNKPLSMDIMLHSSLHAGISYAFAAKRTSYRVNYDMNINLIGMMFVPEYGESYYEISEGIMRGTVHFASLHNCIRFRQLLSFDMQFKRSAWRIGVEYFYGRQSANQLHFQTEQISLVVGTIFFTEAKIRRFR